MLAWLISSTNSEKGKMCMELVKFIFSCQDVRCGPLTLPTLPNRLFPAFAFLLVPKKRKHRGEMIDTMIPRFFIALNQKFNTHL